MGHQLRQEKSKGGIHTVAEVESYKPQEAQGKAGSDRRFGECRLRRHQKQKQIPSTFYSHLGDQTLQPGVSSSILTFFQSSLPAVELPFNHCKADHFTPLLKLFPWLPTVLRRKSKPQMVANRLQAPTWPNFPLLLQLHSTRASGSCGH